VVELDMSTPFTAARARNAGFERLRNICPAVDKVQFVDGDCAISAGWLASAAQALEARSDVGAVCGRRREIYRNATVFNTLCDIEWGQTPPGDADVFGGDVMVRVEAVQRVNGYNPGIIAGEDPEFSLRIRRLGLRIVRLDADMTLHDADMHSFKQWWMRAVRAGYAYAQVSALQGDGPERFWVRDCRRNWLWGLAIPSAVPLLLSPTRGLSSLLLFGYPLRALRIVRRSQQEGLSAADARVWAISCVGASFPHALGMMKYHFERIRGIDPTIIEYKK
jgi:GT2 family glycosyltransferase